MIHNAVENTALIGALQADIKDTSKWIALAESQSTNAARVQILSRAVETVPSSQDLWERFVDAAIQSDKAKAFEVLSDALALFPSNVSLWQRMFSLHPSIETYTTALRHLDNRLVWPAYIQYLDEHPGVSPAQRLQGYQHYCEYTGGEERTVKELASKLAGTYHQTKDAAKLLSSQGCQNWDAWETIVHNPNASAELLASAARIFRDKDAVLMPLAARKWIEEGETNKARVELLRSVEQASSVSSFCELFRVVCEFYESSIHSLLRLKGAGSVEVARMLAEFGNLLRKRPMYLSDIAVRESPNNIELWKKRVELWRLQPHIAADILETALATVDVTRAYQGEATDLWAMYMRLLVANGSDISLPRTVLVKALDTHFATVSEKAKIYIALAELELDGAKNPIAAVQVLEGALSRPALSTNTKLWTAYISTLVETGSESLLEAFSRCCVQKTVTMRIVLMTAKAFPDASANQLVVFNKGVEIFPFPLVLPLWKQYLAAVSAVLGVFELRQLYDKALNGATGHKCSVEQLKLMYSKMERTHAQGSCLLAKRALGTIVHESKNHVIWEEFISLHDETAEKRQLYEQAIEKLDDEDACRMAIAMAKFEQDLNEWERVRAIYRYAAPLSEGLDDIRATVLSKWSEFEDIYGDATTQHELAQYINPSHSIDFVPSTEMDS